MNSNLPLYESKSWPRLYLALAITSFALLEPEAAERGLLDACWSRYLARLLGRRPDMVVVETEVEVRIGAGGKEW